MKKIILSLLSVSLFVFSCSNDDDGGEQLPLGDYDNGILVSAEGGPASVSYISDDYKTVENEIYYNVNTENLGVYLQSVGFNGDLAYIISDNANTITVVNRYTFVKQAEIKTGLITPRYITFLNGRGYVTNWGDGTDTTDDFIAEIDLTTNTVTGTVDIAEGPERILAKDDRLYISHKGGYNINNIISVIDTSDNSVETITVNDAPDEMALDSNGNLVVLCSGDNRTLKSDFVETAASITRINTATDAVIETLEFDAGMHPSQMAHDNNEVYYAMSNKIYELNDDASDLPITSVLDVADINLYGLSVNNNKVYVTNASFTEQSELLIYDLTNASLLETFNVGLGASKIYFN
ncbi:hypothetical protein GCM10022291_31610 [Postechiella marina]|uniref:Uncharacterized protein n=1 Tax=Postechiella marina TaxID=943941 RepID=A0ABP8CGG4_9FLAO